jgi:hypothetical protein
MYSHKRYTYIGMSVRRTESSRPRLKQIDQICALHLTTLLEPSSAQIGGSACVISADVHDSTPLPTGTIS